MAIDRAVPGGRLPLDSKGNVIVDSFRGKMRIRAWPRKRGRPKHYKVRWHALRFGEAAKLTKYAPSVEWQRATDLAHGTGMYPGDWIRSAMLGGPWTFETTDGDTLTKYFAMVHPVTFQGARVQRTTTQNLTAGVSTAVIWQTPLLDTAGFWSAGAPSRLTIPEGPTVAEFVFGFHAGGSQTSRVVGFIRKNGSEIIARLETETSSGDAQSLPTGPIAVAEGDYFEGLVFCANALTIPAEADSFFTINLLGAV